MAAILTVLLIWGVAGVIVWRAFMQKELGRQSISAKNGEYIIFMTAAAFILRVILACVYKGHETDMQCFSAWSSMVYNDGFASFYASDAFTDYPPGYMYVLYMIGAVKSWLEPSQAVEYLIIKLPAIICDILTGLFIYRLASKRFSSLLSTVIAGLYMTNPATIVDSAMWGQVDSVYTLALVALVYLAANKKMIPAYFVFAVAVFIKPQSLIFTPILIYGIVETVFLPHFDRDKFVKNLLFGIGAILFMFLMALPFGVGHVIDQYTKTLASYQYMTINAFNVWGALGMNWQALTTPAAIFGYAVLVFIVAYTTYVFFKSKNPAKYYFVGALLAFLTYMLSTKMHDRYSFPMMVMLLLAFVMHPKREEMYLYIASTMSLFFNTAWVLFIYNQDINYYYKSPVVVIGSIVNIAILVYMLFVSQKYYVGYREEAAAVSSKAKKAKAGAAAVSYAKVKKPKVERSKRFAKMTVIDFVIMAIITAVYAGIAIHDLGDRYAPESGYQLGESGSVTIDLGRDVRLSEIKFFNGSYELNDNNRKLDMSFERSSGQTSKLEQKDGSVFHWQEVAVADKTCRYITLSTEAEKLNLLEFAITDESGTLLTPVNASELGGLFDEQNMVPERSNFRNSTYFDEIYHARTAYEFTEGLSVYEWTHPPLGKVIMAIGILIFGMNPFGWRIAGTVIGMIMVPVMYIFGKKLFSKTWLAAALCLVFTFDFMHFVQTRIATIDVYVTFFIMVMYLFMYMYYRTSFYDTPLKKTFIPLGLCGITMGLAIASKWTGVYAAVGLAVIFFITLHKRYAEYRYAMSDPKGETDGISHKVIIESFKPNALKTIGFCCIFFVVIPLLIYAASYIPYLNTEGAQGLKTIIDNQSSMLTYHGKTVLSSTHPYSSRWYEWIIMKRPVWYYSGTISADVKEGISAFGNPAVWWVGIPAFIASVYFAVKKRSKIAIFLIIGYLAEIVSWIPVQRVTFIYHYFPSVPFITMMIVYCISELYQMAEKHDAAFGGRDARTAVYVGTAIYLLAVVVLFAMFYPVLSGQAVSVDYVKTWLKWFDSWVLI